MASGCNEHSRYRLSLYFNLAGQQHTNTAPHRTISPTTRPTAPNRPKPHQPRPRHTQPVIAGAMQGSRGGPRTLVSAVQPPPRARPGAAHAAQPQAYRRGGGGSGGEPVMRDANITIYDNTSTFPSLKHLLPRMQQHFSGYTLYTT